MLHQETEDSAAPDVAAILSDRIAESVAKFSLQMASNNAEPTATTTSDNDDNKNSNYFASTTTSSSSGSQELSPFDHALKKYCNGTFHLQQILSGLPPESEKRQAILAQECFRASEESDPNFAFAHYGIGVVKLLTKSYCDAFHFLRQALLMMGSFAPNIVRFALGVSAMELNRLDVAKKCFQRIVNLSPQDPLGHIGSFLIGVKERSIIDIADSLHKFQSILPHLPLEWIQKTADMVFFQCWSGVNNNDSANTNSNDSNSTAKSREQIQEEIRKNIFKVLPSLRNIINQARKHSSCTPELSAYCDFQEGRALAAVATCNSEELLKQLDSLVTTTTTTNTNEENDNNNEDGGEEMTSSSSATSGSKKKSNKSSKKNQSSISTETKTTGNSSFILLEQARCLLETASIHVLQAVPHLVKVTITVTTGGGKEKALSIALKGMQRIREAGLAPFRELCEMTTLLLEANGHPAGAVRSARLLVDTVGLSQTSSWYNLAHVTRFDPSEAEIHANQGKSIEEIENNNNNNENNENNNNNKMDSQISANLVSLHAYSTVTRAAEDFAAHTNNDNKENNNANNADGSDSKKEGGEGELSIDDAKKAADIPENPENVVNEALSALSRVASSEMGIDIVKVLLNPAATKQQTNKLISKIEPQHIPVIFNYALHCEMIQQRRSDAVKLYSLLVRLFPHETSPYFRLATVSLESGDQKSALLWMQLCISVLSSRSNQSSLENTKENENDNKQKKTSSTSSTFSSSHAQCFAMIARTLAATGNTGNAAAYKFLTSPEGKLVLNSSSPQDQAVLYSCAGACLAHDAQVGQHVQLKSGAALRLFKQALKLDPLNSAAVHGIACCIALLGANEHASALLERITGEKLPDNLITRSAFDNLFNAYVNTSAHRQALRLELERQERERALTALSANLTAGAGSNTQYIAAKRDRINAVVCALLLTGDVQEANSKISALVQDYPRHPLTNFTGILVSMAKVLTSVINNSTMLRNDTESEEVTQLLDSISKWSPIAAQLKKDRPESSQFIQRLLSYIRKLDLRKVIAQFVRRAERESINQEDWQTEWRFENDRLTREQEETRRFDQEEEERKLQQDIEMEEVRGVNDSRAKTAKWREDFERGAGVPPPDAKDELRGGKGGGKKGGGKKKGRGEDGVELEESDDEYEDDQYDDDEIDFEEFDPDLDERKRQEQEEMDFALEGFDIDQNRAGNRRERVVGGEDQQIQQQQQQQNFEEGEGGDAVGENIATEN